MSDGCDSLSIVPSIPAGAAAYSREFTERMGAIASANRLILTEAMSETYN
ncbi:MAG: hypothetical protein AAFY26_11420 [Cyanobacteria bacterium J06638_22]